MTIIYFVRHAEPNYNNHDDKNRELTLKGIKDTKLVTEFLKDKKVDYIFSSPFKRSIDTVKHFSEFIGKNIEIVEDFRERKVNDVWIEPFHDYCKAQWKDFDYKMENGESLREVQIRNINALEKLLAEYEDNILVIGSHGTALSTIINFYDNNFAYEQFLKYQKLMPWIVKLTFDKSKLLEIEHYNLFER